MSQCSLTATDTIKHQTISGLDRLTWPCQHHLTAESWSATPDRIWQQHEEECFHTYQHSQSPHLCTEGEGNMMLMGWSVPVEDMLWYFMSEYTLRSEFQFQNQSCYKEDTVDNVNIFCQLCYRFASESAILWSARAWQPYAKGSSLLYSVKQRKKKVFLLIIMPLIVIICTMTNDYDLVTHTFIYSFQNHLLKTSHSPARWRQHHCWLAARDTAPRWRMRQPDAAACCRGGWAD